MALPLPTIMSFEGLGPCYYERGEFRAPRRGEFYISDADREAYRAPNDLHTAFWIAVPTFHAVTVTVWAKGREVRLTPAGALPSKED